MKKFLKISKRLFNDETVGCVFCNHIRLLTIYFLIYRNCGIEESTSFISFEDIFSFYGYKMQKNKPKAYFEILEAIRLMERNNYFNVISSTGIKDEEPSYKSSIKLKINHDYFFPERNFFEFLFDEMEALLELASENNVDFDSLLTIYLYMRYVFNTTEKKLYFKSSALAAKDIGISEQVIDRLTKLLTYSTSNYEPLLIVKKLKSGRTQYKENKSFKRKDVSLPIQRKF